MDATPNPSRQNEERMQTIQRLMSDIRASLAAGRSVNEQALLAAHAELMPELGEEFRRLWNREEHPAEDPTLAETIARPRPVQAPTPPPASVNVPKDVTMSRPGTRVPAAAPVPSESADATASFAPVAGFKSAGGGPDANRQTMQIPGYSVQRELSRGGQAVVYIAIQLSTGRKVALKVMRDGPFADERSMTRFQREVQILAALDHPNIVSIMDTGQTADGSHYIAMPYISGVTLDDHMKRRHQKDPTDPSKLLRMFYKICMAVNEAHLRGIVHRDLKPSNIRVDERGEPHVLDFGLARTALDRFIRGSDQPVSITGEFLGSLPWSSPEQAEGDPEKIDMRTDVYSLGVILYQMLTGGRFPYEVVGNIRDVLNNILTTEPKPPSQVLASLKVQKAQANRDAPAHPLPAVNEAIERIVLKSLTKRKEARYQNAGELGKDIARYLLGKPTSASTAVKSAPSPAASAGKPLSDQHEMATDSGPSWMGRHWKPVTAGLGLVVLLVAGALFKLHTPKATGPDDGGAGQQVVSDVKDQAQPNPLPVPTVSPAMMNTPLAADGNWKTLFNGNDFTGWDATPVWQVYDGAIVNGGRGAGTLTLQREYGHFHLRLKTKTSGEASVEFRAMNSPTAGFSVSNGAGGPNPSTSTGSIWVNAVMKTAAPKMTVRQNEWFVLDIVYQGTKIAAMVNDVEVATYSDPALAGLKGKIVLKKAFGGGAQWKDIQIQDLNAEAAPGRAANPTTSPLAIVTSPTPSAIQPAKNAGDWISLFNGKDMTGLDAAPVWVVSNSSTLVSNTGGRRGPLSSGTIRTLREFENFDLQVTTKLIDNNVISIGLDSTNTATKGFLVVAGGAGPNIIRTMGRTGDISINGQVKSNAQDPGLRTNDWYTLEIIYQGTQITTLVNGQEVARYDNPSLAGMKGKVQIVKAAYAAIVEFRGIKIKPLPASPPATSGRSLPAATSTTNTLAGKFADAR